MSLPEDCAPTSSHCRPTTSRCDSNGSVEYLGVEIEQPEDTDYTLGYHVPIGGRIAQLRVTSDSGSGRVTVLINDVPVEGLEDVAVEALAHPQYNATDDNIFAEGDDIVLRVESQTNLLGLNATIVTGNRVVSRMVDPCDFPGKLEYGEIPIVDDLVGQTQIRVDLTDKSLTRKPAHIFVTWMEKPDDGEDDIFETAKSNIDTTGFDVFLNGDAVEGHILHYAYIR